MKTSITREAWLVRLCERFIWPLIEKHDGKRAPKYRVSVGFPKGSRGGKGAHAIGQCWPTQSSADDTVEMFISPELKDFAAAEVLVHELVHASVGNKAKHGPVFKRLAVAIGLEGPMTATNAGTELAGRIKAWIKVMPEYPHAPLIPNAGMKKPGSRLLKAQCPCCGYTVRITRQWVDVAPPTCPDPECDCYREAMEIPS